MGAERNHRRQVAHDLVEHILADDGERNARRGEVLLRAAVDHGVLGHVDRTRKDVRRHVGDQGNGRNEVLVVLGAVDRIVGGDMHVIQIGGNGETLGNVGEIAVFGRRQQFHFAVTLGLLDRLLRPDAGIDVTCFLTEEVGGPLVKEGAGAAADIENLVVLRNVEHLAEKRVGFGHHVVEILGAVRNRKQRKARPVEIDNRFGRIFKYFVCKDRRSRVEIVLFHNILM